MPRITISYRRADSDAIAGRIRDRLATQFGEDCVFMDIDSIPVGIDFRDQIKNELLKNDMLLVVIGTRWRGPSKGGRARIYDENDPVRVEVETALQRSIPVVPVLVGGATMPKPDELPESLNKFSFHNAAVVDAGQDFHQHMDRLIRSLERVLKDKSATGAGSEIVPPHRKSWIAIALAAPLTAVAIAAGVWFYVTRPQPATPPESSTAAPGQNTTAQVQPQPQPQPQLQSQPQPQPSVTPGNNTASAAVAGCKSNTPAAFEDDFKTPDNNWTDLGAYPSGSNVYYENGQMVVKAVNQASRVITYPSLVFKSAIVCMTLQSPSAMKAMNGTYAGLAFWATDSNNFYGVNIYPNGLYQLGRMIANSWSNIGSFVKADSIKQGPNAINEVEVALKGTSGSLFINGVKAQDFKGQPPSGVSTIGFYALSETDQMNDWKILNIVVRDNP
jgi:TIR domain